ncbi:MAG TPA: 2-oxoacid:ferredoxin oxidoreductase subunit beta, partial [Candidatus Marinimicrobia bacterium]|nr:2-oxoacid:ferredoxin oxidoreductase subunit beta [Candidatus Neomarinimicrobiota bacterium]
VFISGIGCSSRFPYYMKTYGFHTIHGRAPTIASGVKLARPDLSVWVITGDGDSLSIGGNHFIHVLRRNIDLNIVLFNNRIYGLTKGQYSPTSELGKVTKSTPFGSLDTPFNPPALALGAQATFVARSIDRYPSHLQKMLGRTHGHKGASFLEVYQNCHIFNDGAFKLMTEKETKDNHVLELEDGQPMIFGKEKNKGIRLDGFRPEVVTINGDFSADDLLVHNETDKNIADILTNFTYDTEFPTPIGVLYVAESSTYEDRLEKQIKNAKKKLGEGNLEDLIRGVDIWDVE